MNERLAAFLMWLVQNPDKLDAFNEDATARSTILKDADLTDEERAALQDGDSGAILELLQATEEDGLTWIDIPRIRTSEEDPTPRIKFTVGFAVFRIKGPDETTTATLSGTLSKGTRKSGARAAKKRGSAKSRTSKTAKASKASKASRATKKRKR